MNVVFVNCTYDTFTPGHSGAICTWVHEVCRVAERDGVQPLLISRGSDHPQYERARTIFVDYPRLYGGRVMSKALGLQKRVFGWVRPRQEAYCGRVADAIGSAGADRWPLLLHNDMELAVSLRKRLPNALILHLAHNNNGTSARVRRRFAESVDVCLAVSDFAGRWNEAFYGLRAGTARTLYNGVDLDAFQAKPTDLVSRPAISYAGKLDTNKAPDILMKACLRLAARTRDFSVQIIGRRFYDRDEPDDYIRELERLGTELRRAGIECRFTGWVDRKQLPQALGLADIHVTPSRWDEPFGLTTLEAMASGMSVIGSRTGGTPEVIGDSGFLFDREDAAGLTDLLEPLVRNAALRSDYGRRARARAEQFSWSRTWRQLKGFILEAQAAGGAGTDRSHTPPARYSVAVQ